ncbi:F-box/kelch-repeat protein-like protein [Tanacetum coccineum]
MLTRMLNWRLEADFKNEMAYELIREAYISATGFAFDRVTEDYKIVTLSFNHEQNNDIPYNSFVYAMKTRTWCQISNPITPSYYETTEGHLVNGVLHWVVRDQNRVTQCQIIYAKTCLSKFSLDYHPNPSFGLDRFPNLYSCIATPYFIRLNTIRSPRKVLLKHEIPQNILSGYSFYEYFYTLHAENQLPLYPRHGYDGITPFKLPLICAIVVGSCNGIICLFYLNDFILWNPLIRRTLKIPVHDPSGRNYISATESFGYGFGFDRITEDYRIVRVAYKEGQGIQNSSVYTMKTRTWREIPFPTTPFSYEETKVGHLVNGVLHWGVRNHTYAKRHQYILTFDVSTHAFGTIEMPRHVKFGQFTIINSSLAVITYAADYAWIWVRVENNVTPHWISHLRFKVDKYASGDMPLSKNEGLLAWKKKPLFLKEWGEAE